MFRFFLTVTVGFMAISGMTSAEGGGPSSEATLIPKPTHLVSAPGTFAITRATRIVAGAHDGEVRDIAQYLADRLATSLGFELRVTTSNHDVTMPPITLSLDSSLSDSLGDEGYELKISPTWAILRAARPAGLFHGAQTIRQLVDVQPAVGGKAPMPCLEITDVPRYRWRGMLLDCGRHFMDKEFVKRYIDLLAYHKMNVFHWHLTEDQGWRIEIKKYPKLTEVSAWRKATRDSEQPRKGDMYGGFYTQDDIREIVAYAKSRYITVVPEIEMPGHSTAALAAYPELSCSGGPFEVLTRWGITREVYCAGNDQTFAFLEDVLSEVLELFPSEFIHIGGDECPKYRWERCEKCQARIKAEGLKDEHELQSYFIRRIEKFLNSKGRRLVGWDEILEGGLAPNATVQSWRGMNGAIAAATSGHDVVSSPTSNCYLDYAQFHGSGEPLNMGFLPLERCYEFEPTPAKLTPEQARHVLGLEGNMWTEHAPQKRIDWQVFPRLCALCEVAWSAKDARDFDNFRERMKTHYRRLDALDVKYFISPGKCVSRETVFETATDVVLENPMGFGEMHYTLDGTDPTQKSPKYTEPIHLIESATLKTRTLLPNGRSSGVAEFMFSKLQPQSAVEIDDAVPGVVYEYYEGSWRGLPDFDQLTPTAEGTTAKIDLSVRKRADNFAIRFSGLFDAPADGTYTFYLTSDDGSRLVISGDVVVDHDGLHGSTTKSGQVILEKGKHPLEVTFFQAGGPSALVIEYEGPGIKRGPVPAEALWHSKITEPRVSAELPRPSRQQLAWQRMEYHAFAHFGINTFTDREWGDGKEDPALFNPTEFDARQWVKVFKDAGMKQVVVTAKHHDGFCLWPSKYTTHSVASSPWRGGKGDVVREVADACREAGLKFGVYLSPWDQHEPCYGDSPRYNEHYKKQLEELLTNYGPVYEVWFDGACGEGPNGKKQVYDWEGYYEVVRKYAPEAVIFSDAGDVRWVGNEHGYADETNWSMLRRDEFYPGTPKYKQLTQGHEFGTDWTPAECDVSIRPGWFYHASQDDKVKSLAQLLDIYYGSVGRNAVLLLNVPPDRRGLIHENDAARLRELRSVLDETFATNLVIGGRASGEASPPCSPPSRGDSRSSGDGRSKGDGGSAGGSPGMAIDGDPDTCWAAAEGTYRAALTVELKATSTFDRVAIQEDIRQGQRVRAFVVEAWKDGGWKPIARGTTIGYKRLLRVEPTTTSRVRLVIQDVHACPRIAEFGLYKASAREQLGKA